MKQKISVLIILVSFFALLSLLWWKQAIKPVNPLDPKSVSFTIEKGESTRSIADKLEKQGLVRSAVAFFLMVRFGGLSDNIQAGNFFLNPSMDLKTIAQTLQHGTIDIKLTIPEGWRKEEIALKVAQEFAIPESEFLKEAREGYLFPDTYRIPTDINLTNLLGIFQKNFDKKISLIDQNKLTGKKISLDELITIASMVEREAKLAEDRPLIAGVILNRLEMGMKLDVDATVQYTLGFQSEEKTWWKKNLTRDDLAIDSPYNTYLNSGLPPTAISNPGLSAIESVLNAPKNNFLYYVADITGKTHFSETIEEHQTNIAKYLNK